jgi:protein-S-isoprenylcysteine O-methyltransferase Ste14
MGFEKEKIVHALKHYVINCLFIWLAICLYRFNHYYVRFLSDETQTALLVLALAYTVLGFIFSIFMPVEKLSQSKALVLSAAFRRVARDSLSYVRNFTIDISHPPPKIEKHEKIMILFLVVKIFFLPIMLNSLFANFSSIVNHFKQPVSFKSLLTISSFNDKIYPFSLSLLFFIDAFVFSFGYAFEAGFLKNKIRSVEPTVFGWFVAIICYPPFNNVLGNYITFQSNDYVVLGTQGATFALRLTVLLLFVVFVWASLALGTKASNLTNRGIVCSGPYRFVRHPAYVSKNLVWLLTTLASFSIVNLVGLAVWAVIYFFRAITEERHLIQDPDYQEYCKKVKYRFIPGVL